MEEQVNGKPEHQEKTFETEKMIRDLVKSNLKKKLSKKRIEMSSENRRKKIEKIKTEGVDDEGNWDYHIWKEELIADFELNQEIEWVNSDNNPNPQKLEGDNIKSVIMEKNQNPEIQRSDKDLKNREDRKSKTEWDYEEWKEEFIKENKSFRWLQNENTTKHSKDNFTVENKSEQRFQTTQPNILITDKSEEENQIELSSIEKLTDIKNQNNKETNLESQKYLDIIEDGPLPVKNIKGIEKSKMKRRKSLFYQMSLKSTSVLKTDAQIDISNSIPNF